MFRGRYEHNVDVKGRLALPAAFKKALGAAGEGELVLTTHISSPCLVAYTPTEWAALEARLAKLPQFDPSVMALRRLYVGGAMECAIDKQGRVLVPAVLRDYAGLELEAVAYWVGAMKTMEIWSPSSWTQAVESSRKSIGPEVLAKLSELGV